jgi:hypothetical protein
VLDALKLRRCVRPAASEATPKPGYKAVELGGRVHVLSEQISRILRAVYFPELELLAPQPLLHPQAVAL